MILSWVAGWLLTACGGHDNTGRSGSEQPSIGGNEPVQETGASQPEENIDLMTMQELRLLRSSLYAGHGTLFNESDLRRYWRENTVWYDTLSRARYAERFVDGWTVTLTPGEQALADRIDHRMAQLQAKNCIRTGCDTAANILNIVNMFQFGEITRQEVMDDLAVNNYAATPDSLLQLFQTYQRNDSLQIPNFVTVDLMAQLSHVYEIYLLRTVEERYLAPMMAELCLALYSASIDQVNKAAKDDIKDMAAFNAAFFAVPYNLLTGKSLKIPGDYQTSAEEELAYIAQQESRRPALMDIKADFDYSAFKPYGHYTRTAALRRYFKAWKWLQLAPFCGSNKARLQRAVLVTVALQTARTKSGVSAMDEYSRLSGTMEWFAGQPAYRSILDAALLLKKERITNITAALDARLPAKLSAMIDQTASGNAPVKYPAACRDGIYFVPQPAYTDDELLQAMTDPALDSKRPFPKAMDVLAAFGSRAAFDKLFLEDREDTVWTAYPAQMAKMTEKMLRFRDWNVSSYNKRLECMLAMQQKPRYSPVFAQKQAWNRKKIETSSALWVKMKHDVLLYGVVPDHPEPPDAAALPDSLPEPLTMGYVEPALPFWVKLREWLELTDKTLEKYRLTTDTLTVYSARLHRYITLMEDAARRELNSERLPDDTYRFIAHVGDSIYRFTLAMIEPEIDRWDWTAGTDRTVAVLEKAYRRHIAGSPSNGSLYAAVGNIDNIYVVVEIDGYLYLTKGAALRYDEFSMPEGTDAYLK
ncbi:MAG: DUF3160 domain-containing protein [Bacteroidales bacterium]|jgi:hypothetical protein|nr:DUF3160 domain-containing protein [Bacteroidales bacterium]